MKLGSRLAVCLALIAGSAAAQSAQLNCHGPSNVEEFRYTWRVRGGLRWIAGLVFPTSGVGDLKTTFTDNNASIESQLLITPANGKSGFYVYETKMADEGQKTLMTYHGYAWGSRSRKEQTEFDYAKKQAKIRKETPEKVWYKLEPLNGAPPRDVLGAIWYLRRNAQNIHGPMQTIIYSDGKQYPVVIRPADRRTFQFEEKTVSGSGFEIAPAPGAPSSSKWNGGVTVYISDDARRIPFRIDIEESLASLQLDLKSVESCAFMQAELR